MTQVVYAPTVMYACHLNPKLFPEGLQSLSFLLFVFYTWWFFIKVVVIEYDDGSANPLLTCVVRSWLSPTHGFAALSMGARVANKT